MSDLITRINDFVGVVRDKINDLTNDISKSVIFSSSQSLTSTEKETARANIGLTASIELGKQWSFSPTGASAYQYYTIDVRGSSNDEFGAELHEVLVDTSGLTAHTIGVITAGNNGLLVTVKIATASAYNFTESNTGVVLKNVGDFVTYTVFDSSITIIATNIANTILPARIAQNSTNRFVTDAQIATWNSGGGGGSSLTYNLLTDASVTLSINNIYKLQTTTLTANRVLTMPAGTTNGDKIKIMNANTTAFTVTLAGSSVYFWNETDILTTLDTANYYSFEWFDGKWMIDN